MNSVKSIAAIALLAPSLVFAGPLFTSELVTSNISVEGSITAFADPAFLGFGELSSPAGWAAGTGRAFTVFGAFDDLFDGMEVSFATFLTIDSLSVSSYGPFDIRTLNIGIGVVNYFVDSSPDFVVGDKSSALDGSQVSTTFDASELLMFNTIGASLINVILDGSIQASGVEESGTPFEVGYSSVSSILDLDLRSFYVHGANPLDNYTGQGSLIVDFTNIIEVPLAHKHAPSVGVLEPGSLALLGLGLGLLVGRKKFKK